MEQINYARRHSIKINSFQTRELNLLLSFVWFESLQGEEWLEIKDLNSRYFISSYGRVLSLCKDGYKLLRPFVCGDGYYYVDLRKGGKDIKCRVHRLVANAFIQNPEDKPVVHHLDTNRRNNKVNNLQWMTHTEHAAAHKKINQENEHLRAQATNETLLY